MPLYTRLNGSVPEKGECSIVNGETGEVVARIATAEPRAVLAFELADGYFITKPNGYVSKGAKECPKSLL